MKALQQMGDFYMELKWDFQSWGKSTMLQRNRSGFLQVFVFLSVPLVSRILPSDVCKIHKSGCSIRLDTTLVDFSDMRWERGDISFIFRGDKSPQVSSGHATSRTLSKRFHLLLIAGIVNSSR